MAEFEKVINEYKRMCSSYNDCADGCPFCNTTCKYELIECPDRAERIITEWASEHPVATNGRKFEEVFGISGRDIVAINKLAWLEEEYKGEKNG